MKNNSTIQQFNNSTSSEIAIKVENVSKKFCKSLKRSMIYGMKDIAKNSLGLSSNSHILRKNEFWAVEDVSFEVKKGETLGIIGPNGSGKTTILKMLNGIFWPDKGKITIKGKTGALIAVGSGFHPMLTGRENIYLNAAILGMSRHEVNRKFDDIVEFADIGDFLDTPVKFYSSGMFVRLGFSVAIHCDPDILLVDEVLAVGDMAFALKCHKKMSKFRSAGGTIVMVSHNLQAIRNICEKALWLYKGKIKGIHDARTTCEQYEKYTIERKESSYIKTGKQLHYDPSAKISRVEFLNKNDNRCENFKVGDYFKIRINFACRRTVKNPIFTVSIFNKEGLLVSSNYSNSDGLNATQISEVGYTDFCIKNLSFKPNKYICSITFSEKEVTNVLDWHEKCYFFTITGRLKSYGLIDPFPRWFLRAKNEKTIK